MVDAVVGMCCVLVPLGMNVLFPMVVSDVEQIVMS